MANYFISYALKSNDAMMSPITHYGNVVLNLPHDIFDESDIRDIQNLVEKNYPDNKVAVLWFQKLPV